MMSSTIEPWHTVNDDVMGGLSTGGMSLTNEGLQFKGDLSRENRGGFSSVRRLVGEAATQSRGVRLTIKGDGRSYQFRLRQNQDFDGIAWRHEFSTDGSTQVIELLYDNFEPVFRGRKVKNAGIIDPVRVEQVGFLISDGIEGEFSLLIMGMENLGP